MVEFGGYELPVQYSSVRQEHTAVREAAGLFDISHMGKIELRGPEAIATAERLFSRAVAPYREDNFPEAAKRLSQRLAGRTIWNVNSTAQGGGVAEMLRSLVAYARGAGLTGIHLEARP